MSEKHKVNVIEEYFKDKGAIQLKKNELFTGEKDTDLKTELEMNRIVLINTLHETDLFLIEKKLKPVFSTYYEKQMRLLISKDRKSRSEFVDVEKGKREDERNSLLEGLRGLGGVQR